MLRRLSTGIFGLALLLVLCGGATAEPLTLRTGWSNTPSALVPILFTKKDILKHNGTSYVLEPVHFAGSSPQITALATGDLEIMSTAFSSFALAIENAHMDDVRIIADGFQDGVDGYYTSQYIVAKDSPIKTIEDLKGKVLVSNAVGGAIDIGMRAMLRQHHLEDKRDLTIIEAQFPTMVPMLEQGKASLIGLVPPFANIATSHGNPTLFTMKEAMGTTEMVFFAARTPFLAKNHAALVDFFEDWLRATRWYIDPANHDELVKIVSNYLKLKPEVFQSWLFTKKDHYRDPNGLPDLDALQSNMKTQKDLGLLRTTIDVRKYADLSLMQEAAQRLK